MPSPNSLKEYKKNSYYHIYNRGINQIVLFRDAEDYLVFIDYLHLSLSPTRHLQKELQQLLELEGSNFRTKQLNNAIQKGLKYRMYKNMDILAYCLMPTHFHLVIYQKIESGMEVLMRRIASGYSQYFNKKYKRRGSLFETRYKAANLSYDPELQVLFTARYVERNPLELPGVQNESLDEYSHSSLSYFSLKSEKPIWFNTKRILDIFQKIKSGPNSIIEEEVARVDNYHSFVTKHSNYDLEEVRLHQFF